MSGTESRASGSDFLVQTCLADPPLLARLITDGDLQRSLTSAEFQARAPALVASESSSDSTALAQLRQWRKREMVRIAWRDLAGWSALPETLADLSSFANEAIRTACAFARESLVLRYGEPCSEDGAVQQLVVVGMGKLGGGELNFSSDIDLVLLFPRGGETNGRRSIANEEFFTRLGQGMIR